MTPLVADLSANDVVGDLSPLQIVALTIYGEARGSTSALRRAIAQVIANRVQAQRTNWGLTPAAVCLAPAQFSCWSAAGGAANHDVVLAAARTLLQGDGVGPILKECLAIATNLLHDALGDDVQGADSYYAPAAMNPPDRVPEWAANLAPTAVIAGTRFYKVEAA